SASLVASTHSLHDALPILDCNRVWVDGQEVNLTETEYGILRLLMQDPERIYPAQAVYEAVWNEPYYYTSNGTVMVHIRNLRLKRSEEHTSELQSRFDLVRR